MAKEPDFSSNACAMLSQDDRDALWRVAQIMAEEKGIIMTLTSVLGGVLEYRASQAADFASKAFGSEWREAVQDATHSALIKAFDLGTLGMDADGEREPWDWFNKIFVSVSGGVTGLFGLPGALADIPISTSMIMRSVAEIARAQGEDISDPAVRLACLEVFALGGPEEGDDGADIGYWATRAALAHAAIEAAIRTIAAKFSVVLTEKTMAMAVPAVGAATGALLNWTFMNYYQEMARVHFIVRRLERTYGQDGPLRTCLGGLVKQAKANREAATSPRKRSA